MNRFASFIRASGLPLALLAGTVLGLGSYFETNDDAHLVLLLRARPTPELPYLPGLSRALAAAYAAAPAVPWYGLVLGLLLALACGVLLAVLHGLLRPRLSSAATSGVLGFAFLVAGLEHWLWFSHARVAALLALAGVLLAATSRPRARLGLLQLLAGLVLVLVACLIRPGVVAVSLLAAAPAALWLAGTRAQSTAGAPAVRAAVVRGVLVVMAAVGVWGAVQAAVLLPASAAMRTYRQRDALLALALDYDLLRPAPRTPADVRAVAAVKQWLLGPEVLVRPANLRRAYAFDGAFFLLHALPAKLSRSLALLGRDYFPLLALLAGGMALGQRLLPPTRRWFWGTQLYYGGLMLGLASLLKLPPRLALPLLTGWVLASLAALMGEGRAPRPLAGGEQRAVRLGLVVLAVLYAVKCGHRAVVLRAEQRAHVDALARVAARHRGGVLLLGGADELLKSLSPWQNYSLGAGPVVPLTGWPAHLPATRAALRRLPPDPAEAQWLLAPELVPLLARVPLAGRAWQLTPTGQFSARPALFWYNARPTSPSEPRERP